MSAREAIIQALSGIAVNTTCEEELGDVVAGKLREHGLTFEREFRLSARDRVDFLVGGVGLELKTKGGYGSIVRQLDRYASCDCVEEIGLITNQRRLLRAPDSLRGKPIFAVFMGGF